MMKSRKGFTLMELLVCIVIIVILSAVTIFSTLEFTASANANAIINNMKQIKAATLLWYRENSSRLVSVKNEGKDDYQIKTKGEAQQWFSGFIDSHNDEILKYLENKKNILKNGEKIDTLYSKNKQGSTGDYLLIALDNTKKWYVCCNLGKIESNTDTEAQNVKIRSKFAENAKKFHLFGKTSATDNTEVYYTNQQFVCMPILTLQ